MDIGNRFVYYSDIGDFEIYSMAGKQEIRLVCGDFLPHEYMSTDSIFISFLSTDISDPKEVCEFYKQYGTLIHYRYEDGKPDHNLFSTFQKHHLLIKCLLRIINNNRVRVVEQLLTDLYVLSYMCLKMYLDVFDILRPFIDLITKDEHNTFDSVIENAISRIDMKNSIIYVTPNALDIAHNLTQNQVESLFDCAIKACADAININLEDLNLVVKCDDKGLYSCWVAYSMKALLFYELQLHNTRGDIIRRCANKTCNNYFSIYSNDKRKIYCSPRCGSLEAKRKQRAREKANKQ